MDKLQSDAVNALATEATHEQWREVFREEDGWERLGYVEMGFARDIQHRDLYDLTISIWAGCDKKRVFIGVADSEFCGNALSLPGTTLGDLLEMANELAATEFCGGWAEVGR